MSSASPHSGPFVPRELLLIFVEIGSKGDKRSLRSDVKINLEQRNRDKKSDTGNRRETGSGKDKNGLWARV